MRVLMLGWEFPPFITGGLGTACYGLTKALDRAGVEVIFALPQSVDVSEASHVRLLSPRVGTRPRQTESNGGESVPEGSDKRNERREFTHVEFRDLPLIVGGAYERPMAETKRIETKRTVADAERAASAAGAAALARAHNLPAPPPEVSDYGADLMSQVWGYARFCAITAATEQFDVIHAHDWLTYPAGLAISRGSGKPLVAHVHSTEFDRSGENVNQPVYDIERAGMHGAARVVTVSQLTKNIVTTRYGVPAGRVEVVYNGVDLDPTQDDRIGIRTGDKIVLYFGRITMQKGPEYFVRAAKRVLEVMDDVKFVVAGSGDMARQMIELAARLGIGHKMLFTGFLRGRDIDRVFALADVYVMPSVSEPFGIAPLEAMGRDVPAIISKSSGVSEVLTHALKVDFWDVDDIANKIVAVLRHPPLGSTLREHGAFEVRRLTWDGAAERCRQIYEAVA